MAFLFLSKSDKVHIWKEELTRLVPDLDFRIWPDAGNTEEAKKVTEGRKVLRFMASGVAIEKAAAKANAGKADAGK